MKVSIQQLSHNSVVLSPLNDIEMTNNPVKINEVRVL